MSKARKIQGDNGEREKNDFYPTPSIATEELLKRIRLDGVVWEPACGDGAISKILERELGYEIKSTDLVDRGYGIGGVDFLKEFDDVDWIITNPPYSLATEFAKHSLECARNVALLLKIQFLEGKNRYSFFKENPPKEVHVFSYRLNINKNGVSQKNSTMFCFAWFIWERGWKGTTNLNWING